MIVNPFMFAAGAPSNLLFEWHCETTDVTTGTPPGSSVGDTTATAVSGATIDAVTYHDGTHSVSIPTSGDYYSFSWSSSPAIISPTAGTIDLWFNITTLGDQSLYYFIIDASNRIRVFMDSGNKYVGVALVLGGTTTNARTNTNVITATGTWYHLKVRWDTTAHSGLYAKVTCDTTTGESNSADNGTTALGTLSGTSGTVAIGDYDGQPGAYYIDEIYVYNNWQS